jgi:deoxyribodipyrimidine photo-lyase
MRTSVCWFRRDLRLHDHPALIAAARASDALVPVYVLDPREFAETPLGFRKTGPFRARFLLESLADLRESLRRTGTDLVVRVGYPELVLPELVRQVGAAEIRTGHETATEERAVVAALRAALNGVPLHEEEQSTLYHPDDLPFDIAALPDVFTKFRHQVEARATVRPEVLPPAKLPPLPPGLDPGTVPTLAELDFDETDATPDPRAALVHRGGETAGLARLRQYLWETDALGTYKLTRNGLLGSDYSSKFSAWLAWGCLSPRRIFTEVRRYEAERVKNESTYWLIFELLWRDYFRFVARKYGERLFHRGGIQQKPVRWNQNRRLFEAWQQGETGTPFVDANLRELLLTGFMSNRGRQNVASYLTRDLGVDWRWGAAWMESQLVDYDVYSNWGNWQYVAGIGNDPREDRYFNILSQAERYDETGAYVRHWLPELAGVPDGRVHLVGLFTRADQRAFGVQLGVTYPNPLTDPARWQRSGRFSSK